MAVCLHPPPPPRLQYENAWMYVLGILKWTHFE